MEMCDSLACRSRSEGCLIESFPRTKSLSLSNLPRSSCVDLLVRHAVIDPWLSRHGADNVRLTGKIVAVEIYVVLLAVPGQRDVCRVAVYPRRREHLHPID